MRRYSNTDVLRVEARSNVRRISIQGINVEAPNNYSDKDDNAVVGFSNLKIPVTHTRAEFFRYLNDSTDLFAVDSGHSCSLQDISGLNKELPLGFFQNADDILEVRDNNGSYYAVATTV